MRQWLQWVASHFYIKFDKSATEIQHKVELLQDCCFNYKLQKLQYNNSYISLQLANTCVYVLDLQFVAIYEIISNKVW